MWLNWIQIPCCASGLTSDSIQNSHIKFNQNLLTDWEMEHAQTYNICWFYGECKKKKKKKKKGGGAQNSKNKKVRSINNLKLNKKKII
jgi:hypothetical protein